MGEEVAEKHTKKTAPRYSDVLGNILDTALSFLNLQSRFPT